MCVFPVAAGGQKAHVEGHKKKGNQYLLNIYYMPGSTFVLLLPFYR